MSVAAARLAGLELPGEVQLGRVRTTAPRRLSSGVEKLDTLLGGGWPRGRLSEIAAPRSCGRTALLAASLAAATGRGELVAYIDTAGALDPFSFARSGVDLARLLWVRPPTARDAVRCSELILQAGGFAVVVLDWGDAPPQRLTGSVWPRLARAAERANAALIFAAPVRIAGSFAAVGLSLRRHHPLWTSGLWPLFDGFCSHASLSHNKLGRPGSETKLEIGEESQTRISCSSRSAG